MLLAQFQDHRTLCGFCLEGFPLPLGACNGLCYFIVALPEPSINYFGFWRRFVFKDFGHTLAWWPCDQILAIHWPYIGMVAM